MRTRLREHEIDVTGFDRNPGLMDVVARAGDFVPGARRIQFGGHAVEKAD
ncbi:hypothetical protein BH09ACT3_BH09ACT3_03370 [soil metagenome]